MEGSIHYPRRVIRTNSDVFQTNKFTCDVPDYDKQDFTRSY